MTVPQLMPWIGGRVEFDAAFSPLVCPTDETVASQMIESANCDAPFFCHLRHAYSFRVISPSLRVSTWFSR